MPLWLSAPLTMMLRYALFGMGAVLVAHGILDQATLDTFVEGAVGQMIAWLLVVGPVAWAWFVKYFDKKALFNALLTPQVLTEAEAKAMAEPSATAVAKVQGTGTLGALLVAIAIGASVTACAKVPPALVGAENAVYTAVVKVDDEFRRVCTEQQLTAPCNDARPFVLELVTAAKNFNRAVAAQSIAGLTDVIAAAGRLAEKVKALPNGQTVQLVQHIAGAVTAAARGEE